MTEIEKYEDFQPACCACYFGVCGIISYQLFPFCGLVPVCPSKGASAQWCFCGNICTFLNRFNGYGPLEEKDYKDLSAIYELGKGQPQCALCCPLFGLCSDHTVNAKMMTYIQKNNVRAFPIICCYTIPQVFILNDGLCEDNSEQTRAMSRTLL